MFHVLVRSSHPPFCHWTHGIKHSRSSMKVRWTGGWLWHGFWLPCCSDLSVLNILQFGFILSKSNWWKFTERWFIKYLIYFLPISWPVSNNCCKVKHEICCVCVQGWVDQPWWSRECSWIANGRSISFCLRRTSEMDQKVFWVDVHSGTILLFRCPVKSGCLDLTLWFAVF